MRFSCYKNDLQEALKFVMKTVAVKPISPILAGIYLKADGPLLELQANKNSSGVVTQIPCSTEEPGEVLVVGRRLYDFVRTMNSPILNFYDGDDSNVFILESGGAKIELVKMPLQEYIKVNTDDLDNFFLLPSVGLRDLIRRTVFAVGDQNARPIFSGCCFEIKDDQLSLVATNTHRLALAKRRLSDKYKGGSFVVPAEPLSTLIDRIDPLKTDSNMRCTYSERNVTINFDTVVLTSRLIDGVFPPYDKVIPTSSKTRVKVDTSELKHALELVALVAKENEYNTARFVFNQMGMEISSPSPEGGNVEQSVDAEVDGDDLEIAFNIEYVRDVLRVIDSPYLSIMLNDRYSPAAFTEFNNDDYIYIVTPVRA